MSNSEQTKKAIIYCRVSSKRQKKEGHGLEAQEHRCEEFAKSKGYEVLKVFKDDITGGTDARPGMDALRKFLDENAVFEQIVVIVDDIKRWARDVEVHFALRASVTARNGVLESPNFQFGNSPEDKFYETIMAASGELERNQNKRQVVQKMKARLERGYWCFDCPPGYKYVKNAEHGKVLVPDEPNATIIRTALEKFYHKEIETPAELARYLHEQKLFHRKQAKHFYVQKAIRILERITYAGYIEYKPWGVKRRKAHHKGLISIEMFDAIQERLKKPVRAPNRKDINADFPLRGFILCSGCDKPLTASWSKGRKKHYGYYRCDTRGCPLCGKSVSAKNIETDFANLIKDIKPKPQILSLTKAIVRDVWEREMSGTTRKQEEREKEIKELERSIENCCVKIEKTTSERVVEQMSKRVDQLTEEKEALSASLKRKKAPNIDYETATDVVFEFVKNPQELWNSESVFERRLVPKLIFTQCLVYKKDFGYETPSFALLFELCRQSQGEESRVVEQSCQTPTNIAIFGVL